MVLRPEDREQETEEKHHQAQANQADNCRTDKRSTDKSNADDAKHVKYGKYLSLVSSQFWQQGRIE